VRLVVCRWRVAQPRPDPALPPQYIVDNLICMAQKSAYRAFVCVGNDAEALEQLAHFACDGHLEDTTRHRRSEPAPISV
jgi:hypothetical protein